MRTGVILQDSSPPSIVTRGELLRVNLHQKACVAERWDSPPTTQLNAQWGKVLEAATLGFRGYVG